MFAEVIYKPCHNSVMLLTQVIFIVTLDLYYVGGYIMSDLLFSERQKNWINWPRKTNPSVFGRSAICNAQRNLKSLQSASRNTSAIFSGVMLKAGES